MSADLTVPPPMPEPTWPETYFGDVTRDAYTDRQMRERDAIWSERVASLQAENAALRTVMVAAAEEIQAHWDVHCDAEGYGPANLMRRLEEGIPAEYGYTAGAFASLQARLEAAERAMMALLPGPYYMDPPDGGSVTVLEQLQRMALDAKRYRWLRDESRDAPEPMREVCAVMFRAPFTDDPNVSLFGDDLDAAIDAATQEKPAAPSEGSQG